MKNFNLTVGLIVLMLFGMVACENNDFVLSNAEKHKLTRSSTATTHQILVSVQEAMDIAFSVLSSEGISIEGTSASSSTCLPTLYRNYIVDNTHYDTIIYAGSIIMDYGIGAPCGDTGNLRAGKINNTFTYIINTDNPETANSLSSSLREVITFDNYKRESFAFDGRISLFAETGNADTLKTNDMKITFPDGSIVLWGGTLINEIVKNERGELVRSITGNLQGSTADRKFFKATMLTGITYNYECSGTDSLVPVKGIVEVKVNDWTALVDYGDGNCDRVYTVTIDKSELSYTF